MVLRRRDLRTWTLDSSRGFSCHSSFHILSIQCPLTIAPESSIFSWKVKRGFCVGGLTWQVLISWIVLKVTISLFCSRNRAFSGRGMRRILVICSGMASLQTTFGVIG